MTEETHQLRTTYWNCLVLLEEIFSLEGYSWVRILWGPEKVLSVLQRKLSDTRICCISVSWVVFTSTHIENWSGTDRFQFKKTSRKEGSLRLKITRSPEIALAKDTLITGVPFFSAQVAFTSAHHLKYSTLCHCHMFANHPHYHIVFFFFQAFGTHLGSYLFISRNF